MSINCIHCGIGRRNGADLLCDLCRDNGWLRKLLAINYSHGALYMDDGELQDNRVRPFIDFKRDTVAQIIEKMNQRAKDKVGPELFAKLTEGAKS